MAKVTGTITVEHAKIGFKNFSGLEQKFNPAGIRNFTWFIDDLDMANKLYDQGWNVRFKTTADGITLASMQVSVRYDNFPPTVYMISGDSIVKLDENTIGQLDDIEIENIDMEIRPYNWAVRNDSGVKAYLRTMYVTIATSPLFEKYKNYFTAPGVLEA